MRNSTIRRLVCGLTFSAGLALAASVTALPTATINAKAPDFTAVDSMGRTQRLSDYAGKTVVLEWTNDGCPFVQKHYNSGNMQALQTKYTGEGIVWLTVISSPPGSQGYATPEKANMLTAERHAAPSAVLLDPKGEIGRLYGAQTTPHMYVITPKGELAYMGAIDDKPTTSLKDVPTARNYVVEALAAVKEGKPVAKPATQAYGCTVKYSS